MMPIPYAFNLLGWSLGSAMLVGVALVSYWTMAVMVQVRLCVVGRCCFEVWLMLCWVGGRHAQGDSAMCALGVCQT